MHISQKLVFLFVMVVISAVSAVAQPVPSDSLWSMFRHDPQHTGLSPLTGDIGTPQMMWSFHTSGSKRSSAAVGDIDQDGKMEVVTVTWDYGVHALNAEDGSLLWLNSDGPYATASPALVDIDGDGSLEVVIGDRDGVMHALRGDDGTSIWTFVTGDWIESSAVIGDVNQDGLKDVVFGSWDNSVYALNAVDGTLLWSFLANGFVSGTPALGEVAPGNSGLEVVFSDWTGLVYTIEGENGSLIWSTNTGAVESSPAIGDIDQDGIPEVVIGAGSVDGRTHALNGEDGSILWQYETGRCGFSSPALGDIDGDGEIEIVIGSALFNEVGSIYALNGIDGSLHWSFSPGSDNSSSPALGDVDGDGTLDVVIGSDNGNLYALEGMDGSVLWTYQTFGDIDYCSPSLCDIDGDGLLEIIIGAHESQGGTSSMLYALDGVGYGRASSDIDIAGTRTGNFADTWLSDDGYENLTEVESKGAASKRYSYLEHKWVIATEMGTQFTLHVEAHHTANTEGDDFVFAYSTDDEYYTDLITVLKTTDDDLAQTAIFQAAPTESIFIRVRDGNRTKGNRILDTVYVDRLFIESDYVPDSTPPAITNITAIAISGPSATITWDTDEASDSVVRYDTDGGPGYDYLASDAALVLSHSLALSNLAELTQYFYVVESTDAAGNTSTSGEQSFTTPEVGVMMMHVASIDLSLSHNGPFTRAAAVVTVHDGNGEVVEGATVSAHWSGLTSDTDQFLTGADGAGSCESDKIKNPSGSFVFTVDDIDKAGWTYVPEENVETSDSMPAGQSNKMAAVSSGIKEIGPNPFNPQTTITFSLERDERAVIGVYDLTGRLVMSLTDRTYSAGDHSVVWHGKDAMGRAVPSGSYVVRLETKSSVEVRKVSLIR